jgi:hypothetical protein
MTTSSSSRLLCLAIALLATADVRAQSPITTPAGAQMTADRIVNELSQIVDGTARAGWRQRVPTATWRDRRGPRYDPPDSVLPQPHGLWCSMATDMMTGYRRDAVFYGLRTERPYDCRLEHVRFVLEPESGMDELYDALSAAISRRMQTDFSKFDQPDAPIIAIGPEMNGQKDGAPPSWVDVRYWSSGARSMFLARAGSTVQVMSQSRILNESLRSDENDEKGGYRPPEMYPYGMDLLRWEVVNALRPTDPEAVEVILSAGQDQQNLLERTALRVLQERARASDEEQRAMLSLAAAFIVNRLEYEGESWQRDRPGMKPLLAYGVRMERSPFDTDVWNGSSQLAEDVRRRRPGTRWGQLAFLDRLSTGWEEFLDGDQYRRVIDQGTAWLKQYPGSPFAVRVMSEVAIAYETWWSLSLAPDDEELVTASEHKEGAEEARRQAIRWYERIIRDAPTSYDARHARRVLIQMTVGVDTGERTFYSVYA